MTVATQPFTGTLLSDPIHSSLQFAITHMQVGSFRASFSDLEARVTADEGTFTLQGRVRADSISITNPPEFREHVLNGTDFFDAANHSEITFASVEVELADDGTFTGRG
ncbi:MAG: YceI family protein, partial [Pseudonocardiaceae bacterium]